MRRLERLISKKLLNFAGSFLAKSINNNFQRKEETMVVNCTQTKIYVF